MKIQSLQGDPLDRGKGLPMVRILWKYEVHQKEMGKVPSSLHLLLVPPRKNQNSLLTQ